VILCEQVSGRPVLLGVASAKDTQPSQDVLEKNGELPGGETKNEVACSLFVVEKMV
jgi:hypothetical protein